MRDPTRTASELENEIVVLRNHLAASVHELERLVRRRLDWRAQVGDHPLPAVATCFLLGFVLGVT